MYRTENKNFVTYEYETDNCTVVISSTKSLKGFDVKVLSNKANLIFLVDYDNLFRDYHFFGHYDTKILPSFFLHEYHTFNIVSAYQGFQAEMKYAIKCFKNYLAREMGV